MKFLIIVAMVLVVCLSCIVGKYDYYFPTTSHNIAAAPYDHFKLAQQSPFVYCKDNPICKVVKDAPPIFTIRGLWPNFSNPPGTCNGENFSRDVMNEASNNGLGADLHKAWENFNRARTNMDFWEYEYNEHGKCSDNNFSQTQYFERAWRLWNEYKAHDLFSKRGIKPNDTYSYSELEEAIQSSINRKTPLLICKRIIEEGQDKQYLQEVRICFDVKAIKPVNCWKGAKNECNPKSPIWYMAYDNKTEIEKKRYDNKADIENKRRKTKKMNIRICVSRMNYDVHTIVYLYNTC